MYSEMESAGYRKRSHQNRSYSSLLMAVRVNDTLLKSNHLLNKTGCKACVPNFTIPQVVSLRDELSDATNQINAMTGEYLSVKDSSIQQRQLIEKLQVCQCSMPGLSPFNFSFHFEIFFWVFRMTTASSDPWLMSI